MSESDELKWYLKELVSWYSLQEVHAAVDELCKEEFAFLKKLYAPALTVKKAAVTPPQAQPQAALEQEQEQEQKLRPDAKVRVVKKGLDATPLVAATPASQQQTQHESGLTDPKDLKKWQKEQEEKKKRELDAQGINPASLLTKENLQRWIVEEKKTYAAVAREYVGLPDSMVASSAKSFGIQSHTTKKRAMIAANKAKK
jgi:hypothetical protein